jgi:hypothetical protein
MKVFYLDEAGDHNLKVIDPQYSVFVLGGIIVDRAYARAEMEPAVETFKRDWFGSTDIILHSIDIERAKKGFEELRRNRNLRNEFHDDLRRLLTDLDYQVVVCVIHKDRHVAKYGARAPDPYDFGLEIVVERFCFEVGDIADGGLIYAEKRRHDLDNDLDSAWENLRASGTYQLNRHAKGQIDKRIIGLSLKAKSVNIAGLQIADLVVWATGRNAMGKDSRGLWEVVQSKMCRDRRGRIEEYGLVTRPRP